MRRGEAGYALLAVLWVAAGVSTLALGVSLVAREGIAAARNRTASSVALWRAEDCLSRARAAIPAWLSGPGLDAAPRGSPTLSELSARWTGLDQALDSPLLAADGCEVTVRAVGSRLDVNGADKEALRKLLRAAGTSPPTADSMVAALLDWRDPDDVPRPWGAEHAWYVAHGREPPRNGPLADVRELLRVRGFEQDLGLDSLLGTEPGRVSLNHAPAAVLASLPGFGPEAVQKFLDVRAREGFFPDLLSVADRLSPAARQSLLRRAPELAGRATAEPDAWLLRSRGVAGKPELSVIVELRLVRAGDRAAVVRRRSWVP